MLKVASAYTKSDRTDFCVSQNDAKGSKMFVSHQVPNNQSAKIYAGVIFENNTINCDQNTARLDAKTY